MRRSLFVAIAASLSTLSPPYSNCFSAINASSKLLSLSFFPSFSSKTHPFPPQKRLQNSDEERSSTSIDASNEDISADVSTEDLKKRIERYMEGDMEALPSIFEAILARKLTGKHEDTDDELMEELRSKTPRSVEEFNSDDKFHLSDKESDESDEE